MLKLYHYWDSFCSFKTRLALEEKEIAFESAVVDLLAFEQLHPDYLALNPAGVVPTLDHNGSIITESTVINEYIEDAFPGPRLLPTDPAGRARARVWVKIEDDKLHEAMRAPTFNYMIKPMLARLGDAEIDRIAAGHPQKWIGEYWKKTARTPVDAGAVDESLALVRELCATMETALTKVEWLAGDGFSLADCAFAPMVDRLEHAGCDHVFTAFPAVLGWIERLKQRPAYRRATPPDDRRLYSPGGAQGSQGEAQ